ncbi:hypothetical protein TKK_0007477 [Trichogramma kaykai]|uniref:Succinate--CoA ligase [ADP-forming] subunit beta, mitochondrial n=1 Tax=Trichogramma kaykai TaxID=54128 RepID=A0ABD2WG70_9HYME
MFKTLAKRTVGVTLGCNESHAKSLLGIATRKGAQQQRQPRRDLNIHENQAYTLLRSACIPTPEFGVAKTPEEAYEIAKELGAGDDLVLKAQVLAGGRGKGRFKGSSVSGVVMCETPEEAKDISSKMLGKMLVTKQTGEAGRICNSVMVTTRSYARKELYVSVMMERAYGGPVVIASSQGGVNIEDVAATNPEAISYTPVDPNCGLQREQADRIACKLGVADPEIVSDIIAKLYRLFVEKDAVLLEINPLVQDICGRYFALDCKCNFDDSAEFRQKELHGLRDWSQSSPAEEQAEKHSLNYIPMDGNIGCMVNGAGLAMATMDIIKLKGGEPANFLDIGGSPSAEAIAEAMKIICSDARVAVVLVNIFAGINRCDLVAEGVIAAFKKHDFKVPAVVRLQGTNADKGRQMLREAKLKIIPIEGDMAEAAETSVKVAEICRLARDLNLNVEITPKATTTTK